jgi:uncharacterized protein involved in cysteine biosynthesis
MRRDPPGGTIARLPPAAMLMLDALGKAVGQLTDPRLRRPIWLTLLLSLALVAALVVGAWVILGELRLLSIGWLDWTLRLLADAAVLVVAWLLFPAAASLVAGFFLDGVAEAVERRHYPDLPPARRQPLAEQAWGGLRFALVALALNLIALPLYLATLLVPPLYLFVFYGLNGYLLGREYFELVALRRLDQRQVRSLRRACGGRPFLAGVAIAFLLTVPLVNLIAPIIATAFMVHLLECWRRRVGVMAVPVRYRRARLGR